MVLVHVLTIVTVMALEDVALMVFAMNALI
jgi:hypothetical protein